MKTESLSMTNQRLSVDIFQLMDDGVFKNHRSDGLGWDWGWAEWQRDWMNATPNRHAYRCLPLTIINQTGWWVKNPVGFTAVWSDSYAPGGIEFQFDNPDQFWKDSINSQFGEGIITWNTPFLFRTKPEGSRLLVCGPTNYFRTNAHPLTALIESDWMTMSFTMNYKIMTPGDPVRFEAGEPLFQVIPLVSNVCADLESSDVTYKKLVDDPEMFRAYQDWSDARTKFHQSKEKNEIRPDQWQKDYFQGRDPSGRESPTDHKTKVKPPRIVGLTTSTSTSGNRLAACPVNHLQLVGQSERLVQELNGNGHIVESPITRQGTPLEPRSHASAGILHSGDSATGVASAVNDFQRDQSATSRMRVDDDWRRWIAENLMLDSTVESIIASMVAAGIDPEEASKEIKLASDSPYVKGADHLRNRLKKREWLLSTYRKLNRLNPESDIIPRRHKLSRGQFLNEYYSTNRPVIITGMMQEWPALRKWNLDFFAQNFGDREIEVQFGRNAGENYEIEREKYLKILKMSEFVDLIRTAKNTNDFYLTANNNSSNKKVLAELWNDIVQIPEYLSGNDPLGGFLWMGPIGTITPFHHDLTNNFMAQVMGRKKVKIAPSWDMPLMLNDFHVFSRIDGRVTPPRPQAGSDEPQIFECILEPGEILFLPIGCLHYVEGVEISVTISFTNFVFNNDFSSFYSTYHQV
jgi:hypothetical protein